MKLIKISSVSKYFNGQLALSDFSLQIENRERIVIFGPSGCGKTTVLRLLAGLIAPDSGSISINDEVVAANGRIIKEPDERNLGMVFQDLALWPHLTVKGNINFGLKAKGIPKIERGQRLREILKLVRLTDYTDKKPAELSGGQQQRVALARALALHPIALLMDEPLSSLDLELNIRLRKEILRLQEAAGFTLLYVTHDRDEALAIATRVVIMKEGRIEQITDVLNAGQYFEKAVK